MSRRTWTAVHSAINRSLKLAELTDHASRLFFHQLIQAVDSHGCIDARAHILLVEVWPLLGESIASTERAVRDCERVGLVVRKRDDKAEWLEIPDWNDKAGALIRRRGRRTFGKDEDSTSPAPVRSFAAEEADSDEEGQSKEPDSRSAPAPSRTASRSNSPSTSSLAAAPSSSPRVLHAREVEPSKPAALTDVAREQFVRNPTLCTPAVAAALVRWEGWQRGRDRAKSWTSERWAAAFALWTSWGPDRLVRAIDCTILAGKDTVFEPTHGGSQKPTAPAADPLASKARADRAAHEREVERRWTAANTKRLTRVGLEGQEVAYEGLDRRYPGCEVAERELRGLDGARVGSAA